LRVCTARTRNRREPTVSRPRGSSRNVRYQLLGFTLHDRTKTRPSTTTAQMPMMRWSPLPARTPMIWLLATAAATDAGNRLAAAIDRLPGVVLGRVAVRTHEMQ